MPLTSDILHTGGRRIWYLVVFVFLMTSLIGYVYWSIITYKVYLHHSKSLPFLSENFVGREREMEALTKQIDFHNHSTRIINIFGPPGFGKSTLAISVGHIAVKDGVEVHYVDMVEFPEKGVKQILAEKILKVKHTDFEDLLEWLRNYRYWYYQILLIFDNCDNVLHNQREDFQDAINKVVESSLNVRVLLTSREVATLSEYFHWYKLEAISTAAANELLDRRVPKRVGLGPSHREQIAKLTGNVPLALQIISSLLHLPNALSLSEVVQELDKDPIPFLSPKHFPVSKQILVSISLSFKYLSMEVLLGGCNLVVFPGSFDDEAASAVLTQSVLQVYKSTTRHVLDSLLRSSLLEVNERTSRYQYHRLIREYFLYYINLLGYRPLYYPISAYRVHYAEKLMFASNLFKYDHHKSLSVLYSEQHNFQLLLDYLRTSRSLSGDFLLSVISMTNAIEVGLLRLRFTTADWCEPVRNALVHLDVLATNLNWYHSTDFSQETILCCYIQLIKQLAKCQEVNHGTEGAIKIYTERRYIIEVNNWRMKSEDYISFYENLGSYYFRLGHQEDVVECHRKIIEQTNVHLATCKPNQCSNYMIGSTYYNMGEYRKAAEFLGNAVEENQNTVERSRTLVMLFMAYSSLHSDNKYLAIAKLLELHDDIMNMPNNELYHNNGITQLIITVFRNHGYDQEASMIEERLLEVVLEIRAQPEQGSVSMKKAYQFAEHLFNSKKYDEVIDVGVYVVESLDLQNPDDVHLKLRVELLIGKAKFHGGNYSEGMDDIETVLLEILSHPGSDYSEERDTVCWYLVPRVKYINTCYDVTTNIRKMFMGTIYFLFKSPLDPYQPSADGLSRHPFPTEKSSMSSVPEVEYLSSSQEVANVGSGSVTTLPLASMEEVLIILFNTMKANMQDNLTNMQDNLYKIVNSLVVCIDSILSMTLYPLLQIPLVRFIINIGCIWIKLWILYGIFTCIRHPLWSTLFILVISFFTLTGQLRYFLRILRDPRLQAATKEV